MFALASNTPSSYPRKGSKGQPLEPPTTDQHRLQLLDELVELHNCVEVVISGHSTTPEWDRLIDVMRSLGVEHYFTEAK
jgi:hypothetical protein